MTITLPESAFPGLTDDEMDCLAAMGSVRQVADGEVLVQPGQRDFSFFAVRKGQIAIIDDTQENEQLVVKHGPNHFSGDVSMLNGQPAVIRMEADGDGEVIEITSCKIRRMLGEVPAISDKLLEAFQMRRQLLEASDFVGMRIIGADHSPETLQLREFLYKNNVPNTFTNVHSEAGQRLLRDLKLTSDQTPAISYGDHLEVQPSLGKVASCLGIARQPRHDLYDVVIVGAGPAGLAAAVYGASEGLKTLLVDRMGPGGQAGQSSKIENYMGFPSGLPGADLANRGFLQALKFGAEFSAPISVKSIRCCEQNEHLVEFCTGAKIRSRAVLIATGASYRRLPIDRCREFEGKGVYYSATSVEARICENSTAIVVGGGNSAGQAAMFLSQNAKQVKLLLRGGNLGKSMSSYLTRRIEAADNIEVMRFTEVEKLAGDERLSQVTVRNNQDQSTHSYDCSGVFIFVGAKPHTDWLGDQVQLDEKGFVLTGPSIQQSEIWTDERTPCELETTCPGIFAAGDVRSGTTKRCAFAAGDGALAITCIHQFLSRD